MSCQKLLKLKQTSLQIFPIFVIAFIFLGVLFINNRIAKAAKLGDGTWSQSAAPGTTTVTFTNGATPLLTGYKIILTFPSTATINQTGSNIAVTGSTTPLRSNNTVDNTITITLDGTIDAAVATTVTMTNALSAYTTSTYAQESLALNTQTAGNSPIDFGIALKTNSNATTITASVPLFVNMAVSSTAISLGTLSTASVASATQTYSVNSNNQSGVTMQISTDGVLDDGNGNDINYVGDGTVTPGSEEYGISATTSGFTIHANYDTGDNDIIQAANNIASSAASVANATLSLTYKASIAGTTVSGIYNQVVTVTIATNA